MKRSIAVFDFDGTLTTKDTFVQFIIFTHGVISLYMGLLFYTPLLILMKMHLYPNGKAKEKLFSYYYKNWKYKDFQQKGMEFREVIDLFRRKDSFETLNAHLQQGHSVYVVSASIEEWVKPWCEQHHVSGIIGTQIEVDSKGMITGRFSSKNCYGQEKVDRFLSQEPNRKDYYLYAYGDSKGDEQMLAFADEGQRMK
jgi:HAD superfamily hydrolase (TIGR01490 family)